MLGFLSCIPFAKSINRLLGSVFGLIEGVIVVGVLLYFSLQYLPEITMRTWIEGSSVSNLLVTIMAYFQGGWPEVVSTVAEEVI